MLIIDEWMAGIIEYSRQGQVTLPFISIVFYQGV